MVTNNPSEELTDVSDPRDGLYHNDRTGARVLELGRNTWKLAFTPGAGQKPRLRSLATGSLVGLDLEIHKAKDRFGLAAAAPVISCYEAGRDGFWLHRFLGHEGVQSLVVDSASIEVNRRNRRAQSDPGSLVRPCIPWTHVSPRLSSTMPPRRRKRPIRRTAEHLDHGFPVAGTGLGLTAHR